MRRQTLHGIRKSLYVLGRGTAAPPQKGHSVILREALLQRAELFGPHRVVGVASAVLRKAGVRVYRNRLVPETRERLQVFFDLLGAGTAVEAKREYVERLHYRGDRRRVGAYQHRSAQFYGYRNHYRDLHAAAFGSVAAGVKRRLYLQGILAGFKKEYIHTPIYHSTGRLEAARVDLVVPYMPQRGELRTRTYGTKAESRLLRRGVSFADLLYKFAPFFTKLVCPITYTVLVEHPIHRSERVSLYQIGTGRRIALVNLFYQLGCRGV